MTARRDVLPLSTLSTTAVNTASRTTRVCYSPWAFGLCLLSDGDVSFSLLTSNLRTTCI